MAALAPEPKARLGDGFPLFGDFPAELRYRIWESFCPDLTTKGIVLEFYLNRVLFGGVLHARTLARQTQTIRAVLATHAESRAFALSRFPDTLRGERERDVIRFNRDVDIVYISFDGRFGLPTIGRQLLPGFFEKVKHLTIDAAFLSTTKATFVNILPLFTSLENLYICHKDRYFGDPRKLRWCTSNSAQGYFEDSGDERIDAHASASPKRMFCWPDIVNSRCITEELRADWIHSFELSRFREVINTQRPLLTTKNGTVDAVDSDDPPPPVLTCELWPMVRFETDRGGSRFGRLATWTGAMEDWDPVDDGEEDGDDSDIDDNIDLLEFYEGGRTGWSSIPQPTPSVSDEEDVAERPPSDDFSDSAEESIAQGDDMESDD